MKSKTIGKVTATAAVIGSLLGGVTLTSHAWDLPSLGGGKKGEQKAVNTDAVMEGHNKLLLRTQTTLQSLLSAQEHAFLALGLKEKADEAKALGEQLKSGNTVSKDALERIVKFTEKSDKEILAAMDKNKQLDDQGKTEFSVAIVDYAVGTAAGSKLVPEYKDWASSAADTMGEMKTQPVELNKFRSNIAPGLYVSAQMPKLGQSWAGTSTSLISYAKSNNIDTSKAQAALPGDL